MNQALHINSDGSLSQAKKNIQLYNLNGLYVNFMNELGKYDDSSHQMVWSYKCCLPGINMTVK